MATVETDGDTITLSVEVDVSEADDVQRFMYEEMARLFGDRYELFVRKNLSYGNSFVAQALKDYLGNPGRYESASHAILDNLDTRIGDKDNRAKNLLNGGPELVGEDLSETYRDAFVYRGLQDLITQEGPQIVDMALPEEIALEDE